MVVAGGWNRRSRELRVQFGKMIVIGDHHWWWLHNNVNTTDLCTLKWLKGYNLYFTTLKKIKNVATFDSFLFF